MVIKVVYTALHISVCPHEPKHTEAVDELLCIQNQVSGLRRFNIIQIESSNQLFWPSEPQHNCLFFSFLDVAHHCILNLPLEINKLSYIIAFIYSTTAWVFHIYLSLKTRCCITDFTVVDKLCILIMDHFIGVRLTKGLIFLDNFVMVKF